MTAEQNEALIGRSSLRRRERERETVSPPLLLLLFLVGSPLARL